MKNSRGKKLENTKNIIINNENRYFNTRTYKSY